MPEVNNLQNCVEELETLVFGNCYFQRMKIKYRFFGVNPVRNKGSVNNHFEQFKYAQAARC